MSKRLTAAVVGTGFIGPVHVEGLRRANIEVAGVLGSTPAKSQASAAAMGLAHGYDSFSAMLADDSVDVVHLATPNRLHFEQATAVLAAGKHVLCEKPLAMNAQESAKLVQIAADSGLAAAVAYNIRFYPLCQEAAAQTKIGAIGETIHVNGSYVQDWLLLNTDFNWRIDKEEGGQSRAVADIGSHWLDLVQFVTDQKIIAVCADLQIVHQQRLRPIESPASLGSVETFSGKNSPAPAATESIDIDTEDAGCVLLRFENGAKGALHVSQTTAGRKNCLRLEIAGTKQALAWNSQSPNELWIGHRDRANERLIRDPALMSSQAAQASSYPGGHNEGYGDTFKQLFLAFYGYIEAGVFTAPPPFPTFEDGHREIVLCDAILQSNREQRWINMGDTQS